MCTTTHFYSLPAIPTNNYTPWSTISYSNYFWYPSLAYPKQTKPSLLTYGENVIHQNIHPFWLFYVSEDLAASLIIVYDISNIKMCEYSGNTAMTVGKVRKYPIIFDIIVP